MSLLKKIKGFCKPKCVPAILEDKYKSIPRNQHMQRAEYRKKIEVVKKLMEGK